MSISLQFTQLGNGNGASVQYLTLPAASAGDFLSFRLGWANLTGGLPPAITDPRGNIWQRDAFTVNGFGPAAAAYSCYLDNAYFSGDLLQVNGLQLGGWTLEGWSGFNFHPSAAFDVANTNVGNSPNPVSGNIVTDYDIELLGSIVGTAAGSSIPIIGDPGWTTTAGGGTGGSDTWLSQYLVTASAATYAASATLPVSHSYAMLIVGYAPTRKKALAVNLKGDSGLSDPLNYKEGWFTQSLAGDGSLEPLLAYNPGQLSAPFAGVGSLSARSAWAIFLSRGAASGFCAAAVTRAFAHFGGGGSLFALISGGRQICAAHFGGGSSFSALMSGGHQKCAAHFGAVSTFTLGQPKSRISAEFCARGSWGFRKRPRRTATLGSVAADQDTPYAYGGYVSLPLVVSEAVPIGSRLVVWYGANADHGEELSQTKRRHNMEVDFQGGSSFGADITGGAQAKRQLEARFYAVSQLRILQRFDSLLEVDPDGDSDDYIYGDDKLICRDTAGNAWRPLCHQFGVLGGIGSPAAYPEVAIFTAEVTRPLEPGDVIRVVDKNLLFPNSESYVYPRALAAAAYQGIRPPDYADGEFTTYAGEDAAHGGIVVEGGPSADIVTTDVITDYSYPTDPFVGFGVVLTILPLPRPAPGYPASNTLIADEGNWELVATSRSIYTPVDSYEVTEITPVSVFAYELFGQYRRQCQFAFRGGSSFGADITGGAQAKRQLEARFQAISSLIAQVKDDYDPALGIACKGLPTRFAGVAAPATCWGAALGFFVGDPELEATMAAAGVADWGGVGSLFALISGGTQICQANWGGSSSWGPLLAWKKSRLSAHFSGSGTLTASARNHAHASARWQGVSYLGTTPVSPDFVREVGRNAILNPESFGAYPITLEIPVGAAGAAAGDTLIVLFGCMQEMTWPPTIGAVVVTDTQGNAYATELSLQEWTDPAFLENGTTFVQLAIASSKLKTALTDTDTITVSVLNSMQEIAPFLDDPLFAVVLEFSHVGDFVAALGAMSTDALPTPNGSWAVASPALLANTDDLLIGAHLPFEVAPNSGEGILPIWDNAIWSGGVPVFSPDAGWNALLPVVNHPVITSGPIMHLRLIPLWQVAVAGTYQSSGRFTNAGLYPPLFLQFPNYIRTVSAVVEFRATYGIPATLRHFVSARFNGMGWLVPDAGAKYAAAGQPFTGESWFRDRLGPAARTQVDPGTVYLDDGDYGGFEGETYTGPDPWYE